MSNHGVFCWNELMTPAVEAAKSFYTATLGWTYQPQVMAEGTYWLAFVPGREQPVAGLMHWPADQMGANDWFAYVAIDDMAATVEKVVAAGGKIVKGPWPIEGVGQIAIVADGAGSVVGFLEPAKGSD